MLTGRIGLINSCNSLETSLDRLKLTLGLPTETPLNIDLRELETLTLRDEMEVAGELVRRARERVVEQLANPKQDREDTISTTLVLLDRILVWMELRQQISGEGADLVALQVMRSARRVDEGYVGIDRAARQMVTIRRAVPPAAPITVFRGTADSIDARLELTARQLQLHDLLATKHPMRDQVLSAYVANRKIADDLASRMTAILSGDSDEKLETLQAEANKTLKTLEMLESVSRGVVGAAPRRPAADQELLQSRADAETVLKRLDDLGGDSAAGLPAMSISVDDAMVTALVQRFELMNQRGFLADNWRAVKIAGDDLKSVLNLNVGHSLSNNSEDDIFDFSPDDGQTQLRATFDLPLNRRAQRNNYRQSLINYQRGRRSQMALEDSIKFSTRQDLRQLSLDRVQYNISVISAALASERVYSTQLELSLGLATVTARDFLEAQRDYRSNLSSVASGRLGYIVNRARLALDLELMVLDDEGTWPELNNEAYQPQPDGVFPQNGGKTYGDFPQQVWPSDRMRRMTDAPLPGEPQPVAPPEE